MTHPFKGTWNVGDPFIQTRVSLRSIQIKRYRLTNIPALCTETNKPVFSNLRHELLRIELY